MIMETNKKSYLKPTIEELYVYEDLSIMVSSEPMITDADMPSKRSNGDFALDDFSDDDFLDDDFLDDDFSDDDEDGLFYKEYTVKW